MRISRSFTRSILQGSYSSSNSLSTSFSTSTPRWPRARPATRWRRHQEQPIEQPVEQQHRRDHQPPKAVVAEEQPVQRTTPSREDPQRPPVPSATPLPEQASASIVIPFLPKKRSAPPNLPPQRRDFFLSETIRQGPSSSSPLISEPASATEARRLALAAAFFDHPHPSAGFLYSAAESLRHHPKNEHVPEVLILGASNVGKSSFLNALIGTPGAARVSARPGKTTLMNAFGVGPPAKLARGLVPAGEKMPTHSLVVLDTPGYGFRSQASWGDAVVRYMGARKALRGAVLLLSGEKRISEMDRWLLRALCESNTRVTVVLTKADKGGPQWRSKCAEMAGCVRAELAGIERTLGGRRWREGEGWNPMVYVTAAGLEKVPKLGNGGGVGGVRAAILEMAGFHIDDGGIKMKDEAVAYTGEVVSFDDIKWKT